MRLLDPMGNERLTPEHIFELVEELKRIGMGRTMRQEDADVLAAASGILNGLAKWLRARPAAAGLSDNLTSLDV
ncbi:MAG TPA: hypothetical protein VIY48_06065 [Candidatus Paceibacterota bacterium]